MIFRWQMPFLAVAALSRSVWARLAGYEVLAASETQESRQEICSTCENLDEEAGQCKICGCMTFTKTALSVERCPVGKWDAIWSKKA